MSVTEEIKQRLDLVDLITSSGVALRKAGRNWSGFCPFHPNTRTPAFYVFPETQSYYCFGCHAVGDAFNFLMHRQGLDFATALEQLAGHTGVQLQPKTPEQAGEDVRMATIRQINEDAAIYWNQLLRNGQRGARGREYMAQRGISETAVETWLIGYAPDDWTQLLVYLTDRKQHAPEDIEAAGLIVRREGGGYYDRFRNRLMFPIRNQKGAIVGFGGRTLGNDHAKYLNTPETTVFHKGSILFGLYEGREAIKQHDSVVLVEGYLDVITAHQAGFRNVVAPMGTALTAEHASVIKKFTRTIILALDADAAGQSATLKSLETLRDQLATVTSAVATPQGLIRWEREIDGSLKIASLPAGRDPDEVIQDDPQAWRTLIAAALPLLDFYLKTLTADLDLTAAKGRSKAIERLAPVIAALSDPVERAHYVQLLAYLVSLPEGVVAGAVEAARRGRAVAPTLPTEESAASTTPLRREDELLSLLLRFPSIRASVEATLHGELARFSGLHDVVRGDIREALQRTENRWIWDLWNEQADRAQMDPQAWAESLTPALRKHALTLVQWRDTPPLPEFAPHLHAAQLGERIAIELRKMVVQQRRQQIKAMYETVDDPVDRHGLFLQLSALNEYQNVVTAPRRSSYFQDLSSRLDQFE